MSLYCVGTIGKLYVRSEQEAVRDMKGNLIQPAQRRLKVEFISGGDVPEYAKEKAREKLSFTGLPESVDPMRSLLWVDTKIAAEENDWTAEELAAVEARLRERDGQGFIIVEKAVVLPPFPNWVKQTRVHGARKLEHVAADAVRFVDEMGLDADQVVAFEQQEARQESAAIIEALTAAPVGEPQETVVAA